MIAIAVWLPFALGCVYLLVCLCVACVSGMNRVSERAPLSREAQERLARHNCRPSVDPLEVSTREAPAPLTRPGA